MGRSGDRLAAVPDEGISLADYAKERGSHHGAGPWFTRLPTDLQNEIIQGWKAGLGQTVIVEWLRACGHKDATNGKVHGYLAREYPRGH